MCCCHWKPQDMETYIYMLPVRIGDSFSKHEIQLTQEEKTELFSFSCWFIAKFRSPTPNIMALKGVWQQILCLIDVSNHSYLDFINTHLHSDIKEIQKPSQTFFFSCCWCVLLQLFQYHFQWTWNWVVLEWGHFATKTSETKTE